jgi:hypothetical protein
MQALSSATNFKCYINIWPEHAVFKWCPRPDSNRHGVSVEGF